MMFGRRFADQKRAWLCAVGPAAPLPCDNLCTDLALGFVRCRCFGLCCPNPLFGHCRLDSGYRRLPLVQMLHLVSFLRSLARARFALLHCLSFSRLRCWRPLSPRPSLMLQPWPNARRPPQCQPQQCLPAPRCLVPPRVVPKADRFSV